MVAAASGGFPQVVLTDMPSVVPLLERNVERNRSELVHDGRCGLESVSLRWDDAAELRSVAALGPYELIVGGDLLYRPQVVEPLLAALRALVGRRTTVLLAASLHFFWYVRLLLVNPLQLLWMFLQLLLFINARYSLHFFCASRFATNILKQPWMRVALNHRIFSTIRLFLCTKPLYWL